jgi:hypothetical protein
MRETSGTHELMSTHARIICDPVDVEQRSSSPLTRAGPCGVRPRTNDKQFRTARNGARWSRSSVRFWAKTERRLSDVDPKIQPRLHQSRDRSDALRFRSRVGRHPSGRKGLQRRDMALEGISPRRGGDDPGPLPGVHRRLSQLDVPGIAELGEVLGHHRIADTKDIAGGPELHLVHIGQQRHELQPRWGVD